MLRPKFPFSYGKLDSCMLIPFLGSGEELMNSSETFDVAVFETSSYLGVGGEEVISNRERGKQSAHLASQKERSDQSVDQDIHDVVVQQMVCDREFNRRSREHGIHEVSVHLGERPLEVDQAGSSGGIVSAQRVEEEGTSLNWLLGAKGRFVLTSERPNKKRKLLGADAGLEQLLHLSHLGAEASSICDICCLGESAMESNRIVNCSNCKVSVHQKCYGLHVVPDGQWLCAWCTYLESAGWSLNKDASNTQTMPWVLCPKEKGALKPVKVEPTRKAGDDHLKFAHLFCSLWTPEVFVEDMESMEPVTNLGSVQENQMKLMCSICKVKHGACVRCSHGTCRAPFHPICARGSKHHMEIWGKYGHPNVELRAFCSNHSAVGHIGSVEKNNDASGQTPTKSRPSNTNLINGKIPKLRFTCKNKDIFMNCETSTSSSGNLIRVGTIEQGALPHTVKNTIAQPIRSWQTDTGHLSVGGDHMRSYGDIAVVLRKLIDSGKLSVGDVASEVGISSESLEAALVGETTTFSHGLKLKINKWLQNSAHMHAAQGSALKRSSMVVQDDKPAECNATKTVDVKSPLVPDDDKGALIDVPGSAANKLSPTRSKSNSKILKNKNATRATGVTILQNGDKHTVKEGANLECSPSEEFEKEYRTEFSPISSKDVSKEEQGKPVLNTISGNKEEIPNENQGVLLGRRSNYLTEAVIDSELEEEVSSLDHCLSQGDNAKDGVNSFENGFGTPRDCDSNCFHGQSFFVFDDSHSYIHPFIKKKMAHYWDMTFKQNTETPYHHVAEPS